MRFLRGLLGGVLWIVGGLLGLVGIVLCVTILLLPLGIPLLMVSRRVLSRAVQLMLPRALAHPIGEVTKVAKKKGRKAKTVTSGAAGDIGDALGDVGKKARKLGKRIA